MDWTNPWGYGSDGYVDTLYIQDRSGNGIALYNYFGNNSSDPATSSSGSGLIESIVFNDRTMDFEDVQAYFTYTIFA